MKKILGIVLGVLLILGLPTMGLSAAGNSEPLYKYVKNADGSYGYDETKPVYMYNGSTEQVEIPTTYTTPKRQFRTAWVATIANLNMPKVQSEAEFQAKYTEVLDTFSDWNMNAMIFQVRPMLDSYYPSEINPWSEFVSGSAQGTDPGYDPLAWMIDATHERGMEYHAWFNPYRVTNAKLSTQSVLNAIGMTKEDALAMTIPEHIAKLNEAGILADNNFAVVHPDMVLRFEEKLFLDPGVPAVQQTVIDTVQEVIENYDVDAIHFDDYFYPYRITVDGQNVYFGDAGEDDATFATYGAGYENTVEGKEAWRRDNITALVEGMKAVIDTHNANEGTAVQLGMSPFGIWEHKSIDDRGSNTPEGSSETYSKTVFADTRKWVKDESIDYIIPQIYWSFDQAAAPYGDLTAWWSDVVDGTHVQLYIGHANYKHLNNGGWEAAWMNSEEVANQMRFNQLYNVSGSALFSYNDIKPSNISALPPADQPKNEAKNAMITLLHDEYFNTPALAPAKPWLAATPVAAPTNGFLDENDSTTFTWSDSAESTAKYYVVYRGDGAAEDIIANPENIVEKIWRDGATELSYTDESNNLRSAGATYVVTALDAAQNESTALVIQPRADATTDNNSGSSTATDENAAATNDNTSALPTTGQNFGLTLIAGGLAIIGALVIWVKRKKA